MPQRLNFASTRVPRIQYVTFTVANDFLYLHSHTHTHWRGIRVMVIFQWPNLTNGICFGFFNRFIFNHFILFASQSTNQQHSKMPIQMAYNFLHQ